MTGGKNLAAINHKRIGGIIEKAGITSGFLVANQREADTCPPEIEYGGFELSAGLYAVSKSAFEARVRKVGRNWGVLLELPKQIN